ncbi:MAG: branched-chain amino acid ABC transporter permease [Rhizobiaceae bacterium]
MGSTEIIQFTLSGITLGSIYALIALGFAVMLNATGMLNFAQGQFVMLGGVLSAVFVVSSGWPIIAAISVAIVVGVVLNGFVERVVLRNAKRADRVSKELITLGIGIVLESLVLLFLGADDLSMPYFSSVVPFRLWGATMPSQAIWIIGVSVAAMTLLILFYRHTIYGIAMLACSMNREAASLVGIRPARVSTIAFALGGGLGVLGGALIIPLVPMNFSVGLIMSLKGFAALVIGGLGSVTGAIAGGLLIGLLEAFSAGLLSSFYKEITPMLMVILVLLVWPRGLFGGRF